MTIEVEKSCPANWAELREVVEEVEALAKVVGLPRDDVEPFSLALWEALVNALVHGNRGRQDSRIWLGYGVEPDRLWARVRDQGEGFDSSRLPDPREGANFMSASGRGILMIRSLCDNVEWSRGGREIRLLKFCCSPAAQPDRPAKPPALARGSA